jgi:hypothetical protein
MARAKEKGTSADVPFYERCKTEASLFHAHARLRAAIRLEHVEARFGFFVGGRGRQRHPFGQAELHLAFTAHKAGI